LSLAKRDWRSVVAGLQGETASASTAEAAGYLVGQDGYGCLDADQRSDSDGDDGDGQPHPSAVGQHRIQGETENISHHKSSTKDLTFKNRKISRFKLNLQDNMHLIYTHVFHGKEKIIRPSHNR
jgi:hypothetical protein